MCCRSQRVSRAMRWATLVLCATAVVCAVLFAAPPACAVSVVVDPAVPSAGAGAAAATAATAAAYSGASKLSDFTFPPPRPVVPSQFRAKAKVWLGADITQPPVLLLYHHDDANGRSREDYYHLVGARHERFYTSIKLQATGQNFMILHKQPKSPRACFITPLLAPLFDAAALETAVYVGPATVQWWTTHIDAREGADVDPATATGAGADASATGPARDLHNHTCAHWRLAYDGERVELCLDAETGAPLLVHHPYIRAHILDWTVPTNAATHSASSADGSASASSRTSFGGSHSSSPFAATLFDPSRASVAKCAPFGASTASSRS